MTETGGDTARYAWLAAAVEADATIITSSRRLARELRTEHDRQQVAAGKGAWPTPQILFWQDWLATLLQSAPSVDSPHLIDANTSTILWERSMRQHLDSPMAGSSNLLRQARTAWQRLLEWRVPIAELAREARSFDERMFAQAAQSYCKALGERHWADTEQLAAHATGLLQSGKVTIAGQIVYTGFDRISPVLDELLAASGAAGSTVVAAPQRNTAETLTTSSYANVEAELRAAGAWARARLLEDSTARIAIVAGNLEIGSARFARLIREGLAPGWQCGGEAFGQSVNVSYGRNLSDFPAIHVALLCLRWTCRGLASRDVSILLRSPFLGDSDAAGRSRLELRLRHLPDRQWTAAALGDALADMRNGRDAQTWLDGIRRIAALQTQGSEENAPGIWAGRMDELLTDIGWPGQGSLHSDEFQLINRWRNLLHEFSALDTILPTMTFADAVRHLARLARDTVYQPDTGEGLVQLLGSLEAAGMEFDHVWIAGMDASRWPSSGQPLALVSRNLQRAHEMPDASPQDSLEYSRRVIRRLLASARAVHLSWAHAEQDILQRASPLLAELPVRAISEPADPYWYVHAFAGAAGVHTVAVDPVPSVDGTERVAGGAYTVQRQTVEPFAAFAFGRLGIRELQTFEEGLSPSLRGSMLHDTLYHLLRERPSRDSIAAWSEQEIASRIDAAISKGLSTSLRFADAVLRRLIALERTRLRAVVAQFLAMEKTRPEFSIEQVEERIEFELAGVHLTLRADRIDRLLDGTLLIIDYKTGRAKHLVGRDGNPVDLQLVVYAAALTQDVGGLALFNVGRRGIVYKGIAGSMAWNNVVTDDWQGMLLRWKSLVHAAVGQLAAGDVRINLQLTAAQSRPLNVLSRAEEQKRGS